TVADLAAYARQAGADPKRWSFLRGEKPAIVTLAKDGFKLGVADGAPDDPEPILHSTRFVLVDRARAIRGYYDSDDPPRLEGAAPDTRARPAVTVRDLPTLNAALNATSAVLLIVGFFLVRARKLETHRRVMTGAFGCSVVFLVSYLAYHIQVGSVRFQGTGTV